MVASIGKGISAGYYLRRTEYYLSGQEPDGVWLSSSSPLGIVAGQTVEAGLFERVHEGLGPDGKLLLTNDGGRKGRVSGYDITLSAPKSVSVLYALADPATRKAIENVQLEASEAVVAALIREAAFTRRGKDGLILEKASLIVAAFQHSESRPAPHADGRLFSDMDLHTHLCIANLAERPRRGPDDGISWGALDGRALFAHKMVAGSVYHLALSSGLERLGFRTEVSGKNGIFELRHPDGNPVIAEHAARYFSARRSQIERRLAEYDVDSASAQQLAAAVGRATRLSKADVTQDRFEMWAERAAEQGIEIADLSVILKVGRRRTKREAKKLIEERLAALPRELTEHESVFERRTLLAAIASALVGTGADVNRIEFETDRLLESKAILELSSDIYGHGLYSTPEMVAIERDLLKIGRREAKRRWAGVDPAVIEQECIRRGLSGEQRSAVLAATSADALTIVSGAAGSGKTTALKIVVNCYKDKKILASATAWRTARMLNEELNVPAFAIDSLLARIRIGQPLLDKNTVLLIDECGQIGSRSMHELLQASAKAGAKVVLVGDAQQLQPISAGPALKILSSVIEPNRIDKIIRQREQWARDAARSFAAGLAAEGLDAYDQRDRLQPCAGGEATVIAAVDQHLSAKRALPGHKHLLIAKSNKVVRALNAELRKRRRDEGLLQGPDFVVKAGDASGRPFQLALAVGDDIRFGVRQDNIGAGVINGTVGHVLQVTQADDGNLQVRAQIDGKQVAFSTAALRDKSGYVRLGHNYAVTAYSCQGLTAETATVVLDTGFDRHDTYVAMSRSRGDTSVFYDGDLLAAKLAGAQELNAAKSVPTEQQRLTFLANSIGRANLKTSTLAFGHVERRSERIREQKQRSMPGR
ncbi:conjugative relaxase domain-containing protein, TrwC/TraI family [Tardiphaga sp. OK246]|uniref:MobF family relaxase n=1 Tax=Tardiphaga sp. OK246 TaxID=1855307 RepID=UPI000B725FDE|nr:MobF family relaxase [Tardiphaga sp. OK246]SNT32480.1 conjugative relaxase domain-containing protein, TrwC/TraI family [Tardiphaga sp. OK246]